MHTLSREEVEFYNENGFLRLKQVYPADELRWLSDELGATDAGVDRGRSRLGGPVA